MKSTTIRQLIVLAIGLIVTLIAYGPFISASSDGLPMAGEDAFKNFYTVSWYINHNSTSHHFTGMNYPFGEHVIYTDNQPLVSSVLKAFNTFLPISENLSLVMMLLIFGSCILGAWSVYKIAHRSGMPTGLQALLCIAIILLSPQLQRINGHYSLAFIGLIPWLLWLDYRVYINDSIGRKAVFALALLASGFIHPYLLVMSAGFFLLGGLTHGLIQKKSWRHYALSALITLGPVILFQALIGISDPITDRPENPYGFLVYKASIESVFLPIGLPYFQGVVATFSAHLHPSAEGFFYLGMSSIIAAVLMLVHRFRNRELFRVQNGSEGSQSSTFIYSRSLGSLPILLLAMGLPFAIHPLEEFLPALGPLRQFRGIGRFVFVAYYALGLNLLWVIGQQYLSWKKTGERRFLAVPTFLSLLLLLECLNYRQEMIQSRLPQVASVNPPAIDLDLEDVQCIHPLPYYHIGSEVFRTKANQSILRKSLELSLATGLPLSSVQMSRTSLSQTLQQFDLNTTLNTAAKVLELYDADRPILLAHVEGESLLLHEQQLVDKAEAAGTWNGLKLYRLKPTAFEAVLQENASRYRLACEPDTLDSSIDSLYFNSFGDGQIGMRKNSLAVMRSAQNDLLRLPPPGLADEPGNYILSFWLEASHPQAVNTQILVSERAEESLQYDLFEATDRIIMMLDGWALIEIPFERKARGSDLKMIFYRDGDDVELQLDDLMIRREGTQVCLSGKLLNCNNRIIEPDHD